jgi:hypothetical protein
VAASYTLAVANCTVGVAPVEAQRLALDPNATMLITPFQVSRPVGNQTHINSQSIGT